VLIAAFSYWSGGFSAGVGWRKGCRLRDAGTGGGDGGGENGLEVVEGLLLESVAGEEEERCKGKYCGRVCKNVSLNPGV